MTQSTFAYSHHFNNHVIDWYLWKALHSYEIDRLLKFRPTIYEYEGKYFSADDWTRYDGELL